MARKTGGIRAGTLLSSVHGSEECSAWLVLRAKGTLAQAQDMLDILRDVLLDVDFDNPGRFLQLALEEKAGAESGLIPGGHAVVNARLGAHFTEAGWVGEQMGRRQQPLLPARTHPPERSGRSGGRCHT